MTCTTCCLPTVMIPTILTNLVTVLKGLKRLSDCQVLHPIYPTFTSPNTPHIYLTQYTPHLPHPIHPTFTSPNTPHIYLTQYTPHLPHPIHPTFTSPNTPHIYLTQYTPHLPHPIHPTFTSHTVHTVIWQCEIHMGFYLQCTSPDDYSTPSLLPLVYRQRTNRRLAKPSRDHLFYLLIRCLWVVRSKHPHSS